MFQKLFQYIEDNLFDCILRAFHRADNALADKAEKREPILIEAKTTKGKSR